MVSAAEIHVQPVVVRRVLLADEEVDGLTALAAASNTAAAEVLERIDHAARTDWIPVAEHGRLGLAGSAAGEQQDGDVEFDLRLISLATRTRRGGLKSQPPSAKESRRMVRHCVPQVRRHTGPETPERCTRGLA